MNIFARLTKEGKIGQLCKRTALFIAAIGTLGVLLQLFGLWQEYHSIPSPDQGGLSFFIYNILIASAFQLLVSITTTIFFSLILYVVGIVVSPSSTPVESDITIETITEEEEKSPLVDEQIART